MYPMPMNELIDRFVIALVRLHNGTPEAVPDTIKKIISFAPHIDAEKHHDNILKLYEITKVLWRLEDDMSEHLQENNLHKIAATAHSIRYHNTARNAIKKAIAKDAGELSDTAKYYKTGVTNI